jgi:uncharacterized Zn finger protein
MVRPLDKVLTLHTLRRLADSRSHERGTTYAAEGRVSALLTDGTMVTAKVRGNDLYIVRLRAAKGRLDSSCTCPVGRDEDFCKHCVAVGLAYLKTPPEVTGKAATGMEAVRAHLASKDKGELVDLLMKRAGEDGRLRQRLVLEAAKVRSKGVDFAAYRRAVDAAVDADGLGEPDEDYEYVDGVQEAVNGIRGLLKAGHAAEAVELAEYALKKVESVMEQVYDEGTGVSGLLEELQEIHLKACRKAKPEPLGAAALRLGAEWGLGCFPWRIRNLCVRPRETGAGRLPKGGEFGVGRRPGLGTRRPRSGALRATLPDHSHHGKPGPGAREPRWPGGGDEPEPVVGA